MKTLKEIVVNNDVCSIPWTHIEVNGSTKEVFPCCKYKKSIGIIDKSVSEVWQNKNYDTIRSDLLSGTSHKNCSACDVPSGQFSYKNWKKIHYMKEGIIDNTKIDPIPNPRVLHLGGFTNLCNLACRMCNPQNSSVLENYYAKTELGKFFPLDKIKNDLSIDAFDDFIDGLTHMTISGGEPFFDKNVFLFLKKFQNLSNLKRLNFSTNLTKLNFEMLDLIRSIGVYFTLSISLDGDKLIHEYIRNNCNYDTVLSNLEIIRTRYPEININFNTTVSAYNVGYVHDTLESFLKISKNFNVVLDDLMISPVLNPDFLHPGVLPKEVKDLYRDRLNKIPMTKFVNIPNFTVLIQTAQKMLNEDQYHLFDKFVEYTNIFDRTVKTDYKLVYPELAPLERFELP